MFKIHIALGAFCRTSFGRLAEMEKNKARITTVWPFYGKVQLEIIDFSINFGIKVKN